MNNEKGNTEVEIDIVHLLKVLWKNIAIILVVAVAGALIAFVYAKFIISPTYQATAMMYVNNKSESGSTSYSTTEISAAKSLVSTYSVIMKTRSTLEQVIDYTGVDYTYRQLAKMISAASVESTEIFKITVTAGSPEDAELIARGLTAVLPEKIADVVDGARVKLVDEPFASGEKSSPSVSKYVIIGALLGFVVMAAVVIVFDILDDKIHDEKYITENYKYPVLAVIPNIYVKNAGGSHYEEEKQ